ncbi:hypothetical protein NQ166_05890 [Microbacterium sp. zg.Y1090]|uniref:hypothetical protein n=1 Tax=Microbacterium TaxID=33882 RepID=UPI00214AB96A|nr:MULTISPECIES: hypothetical protein [unclassified Microbacterium]MCR2812194.1 hypothetical protein [Microbacterium sp. zg.Y1084]MCR2818368.1 hypothetical protein [Microbacterium sp. zg.Y1090]MDL5486180.1 hypothetical protein [Microbacterium sp. zg-Y1211]WIM29387.1 hypothetical protein QNO26_05700 [Microbacterium sp. zg-Y1090]
MNQQPVPPASSGPSGWQPGAPAPYGAYPAPGFVAPYTAPGAPRTGMQPPAPDGTNTLGILALVLALVGAVGAGIVAVMSCAPIGEVLALQQGATPMATGFDLAMLAPVRGEVLATEVAFWSGTVLGTWGFVQGIVAIARRRGRGAGIAAVVVAAVGPVIFGVAAALSFSLGVAASLGP